MLERWALKALKEKGGKRDLRVLREKKETLEPEGR
jgi:hypothetical protein